MTTKSKIEKKSNRGGIRPGAGRPRGIQEDNAKQRDYRAIAVELALAGIDRALQIEAPPDADWGPAEHRTHIAMLLLGVPPRITAAALFKPQTSDKFRRDVIAAIKAVEADCA
jgi:hypothetical protein